MNILEHIGKYAELMKDVFKKPQRWRLLGKQYVKEVEKLGVDSLGIVIIISVFESSVYSKISPG